MIYFVDIYVGDYFGYCMDIDKEKVKSMIKILIEEDFTIRFIRDGFGTLDIYAVTKTNQMFKVAYGILKSFL